LWSEKLLCDREATDKFRLGLIEEEVEVDNIKGEDIPKGENDEMEGC
jgi:hypothetical protein